MKNRPVKIVDNLTPEIIQDVRRTWRESHPSLIADWLNTRYGRVGVERFTEHHIWNIAGIIRQLDRSVTEG